MLDYPLLAAVAAVVREGSFERAARALHLTRLLCLNGIESAYLRNLILKMLDTYSPNFDADCINLIEEAFFVENNIIMGESNDELEGSDIEIPGKLI